MGQVLRLRHSPFSQEVHKHSREDYLIVSYTIMKSLLGEVGNLT